MAEVRGKKGWGAIGLTICLLAWGLAGGHELARADEVGKVVKLDGRAWSDRITGQRNFPLGIQSKIFMRDKIRTDRNSRLRIRFADRSLISMAPDSSLNIDRYVYDPRGRARDSVLRLLGGKIKAYVNDLTGYRSRRFRVETPTAVLGVRGTIFLVWLVDIDTTGICALEKEVGVRNVDGPPREVILKPRWFTRVRRGQAPDPPEPVPREILEKIHDNLFPDDDWRTSSPWSGGSSY